MGAAGLKHFLLLSSHGPAFARWVAFTRADGWQKWHGHSATLGRMFEAHFKWDTREGDFRLRNAEMRSLRVAF